MFRRSALFSQTAADLRENMSHISGLARTAEVTTTCNQAFLYVLQFQPQFISLTSSFWVFFMRNNVGDATCKCSVDVRCFHKWRLTCVKICHISVQLSQLR